MNLAFDFIRAIRVIRGSHLRKEGEKVAKCLKMSQIPRGGSCDFVLARKGCGVLPGWARTFSALRRAFCKMGTEVKVFSLIVT